MSTLVWLRNNLRLHDNRCITEAAASDHLLIVFIFPERICGHTPTGFRRTGPFRAAFLIESVKDTARKVGELGGAMVVYRGDPATILGNLCDTHAVDRVILPEEAGTEEGEEEAAVAAQLPPSVQITRVHDDVMYRPADLPFPPDSIPDVFSDFRRAVEAASIIRAPLPTPTRLPPPPASFAREVAAAGAGDGPGVPTVFELSGSEEQAPDPRGMRFDGGETAGLARLKQYIWETEAVASYKKTRNGFVGRDYSSKLSPWLAVGALSPRTVSAELARFERHRMQNESTYALRFELTWRDYFFYLAKKYGRRLFALSGPANRYRPWSRDEESFAGWCAGSTGEQIVDAAMRELSLTGYTGNRARQIVASYLARDMGLDWRMGAEYFESLLVDYDPASNYGNWTYTVGVGTDPRKDRYFNPRKQAERYDPDGTFRDLWLGGGQLALF